MEWKGRRSSSNVDDARGSRTVGDSSAGAGMLLSLVGRRFGIKGILVMIVLGVILWQAGLIDPNQLTGGPAQTTNVPYQAPTLVINTDQYPTGCGTGQSAMGPFYCPADRKVYIDPGFYDELEQALMPRVILPRPTLLRTRSATMCRT